MKMVQEDKWWSEAVKNRALNRCESCFKARNLQSHHFISRRFKSVRFDVLNGFCLCSGCHLKAHHRPSEFVLWAIEERGEVWHEMLRQKSNKIKSDVSLDVLHCKTLCGVKK